MVEIKQCQLLSALQIGWDRQVATVLAAIMDSEIYIFFVVLDESWMELPARPMDRT